MKRIYIVSILFVCLLQLNCKNPLSNIKLYVRNDYFKYTVTVQVQDAANPNVHLDNALVSISGPDGENIFAKDGTKKFKISNGYIDFSLVPTSAPSATKPIQFTVNISLANYVPVQKIITINNNQNNQRYTVRMINSAAPPGNVDVTNRTIVMNSGGLSKPGYSGARTTGFSDDQLDAFDIALYVPGGTQFYYYQDNSNSLMTGTRATILTHDSTVTVGATPVLYRPTTNYYNEEYALIPQSQYTKVNYTGSNVSVYMVYQKETAPPFSLYYNGNSASSNQIVSLSSSSSISENAIVFSTATTRRLIGVYFVAKLDNGEYVTVSPLQRTDSNWFVSYLIDPTKINPQTGSPFADGDVIETGIDYNPSTSYPVPSPLYTFTAATLNTLRSNVRMTSNGNLRVECQSTDVGNYAEGVATPFDFEFRTFCDTNVIPDPENLYANAMLQFSSGGSSYFYNLIIEPTNTTVSNSTSFTGTLITPIGVTPSFDGSIYKVYYWDSAIGTYPVTAGATNDVFTHKDFSNPYVLYPDIVRFMLTLDCPAAGSGKLIQPDFNGSIASTTSGVAHVVNCNVVGGYWKTRGMKVGADITPLTGNACGSSFTFPDASYTGPKSLGTFNYITISNKAICNCYFNM